MQLHKNKKSEHNNRAAEFRGKPPGMLKRIRGYIDIGN